MARRSQNAFLKRQKELKRLRKAREKMAKRQGKSIDDLYTFEGPVPPPSSSAEAPADPEAAEAAEAPADSDEAGTPADEPEAAS